MKKLLLLLLFVPLLVFSQNEKRLALVIGNSDYDKGELKNPVNDAKLIYETLDELDFEVMLSYNLKTRDDFIDVIRDFHNKVDSFDVFMIYYAGHGIQVDGINYLVPTQVELRGTQDVIDYCIPVNRLMSYLKGGAENKTTILVLDACRNNPFENTWTRSIQGQGLAKINGPSGTFIAYSTDYGEVASDGDKENSAYCLELSKNLLKENITIETVFKNVRSSLSDMGRQMPVEENRLIGDLMLNYKPFFDMKDFMELSWMQRELEFQHQSGKYQFSSSDDNPVKLGDILNDLLHIRKDEVGILSINNGKLITISDIDSIWNYNLLNRYHNLNGKGSYKERGVSGLSANEVITLSYRDRYATNPEEMNDKSISKVEAILIIHLSYPYGLRDKAFYVNATFCKPTIHLERGKSGISPQPESFSILMTHDVRNREINKSLYENTMQEILKKVDREAYDSLSYLDKHLLDMISYPDISQDFYSGKAVLKEKRYWDAIKYFENVHKYLSQQWWSGEEWNNKKTKLFTECSYLIGWCYYELGFYEKALYHLEYCYDNDKREEYVMEYINCLIANRDFRSIYITEKELRYEMEKEQGDINIEYVLFLWRRKAYLEIEFKQYEKAKEILEWIISINPNDKVALQELEYIKSLGK